MGKVYVVCGDSYCGRYGAEIYLYAVCTEREKAEEIIEINNLHQWAEIEEVELDKFNEIYLGGYIEWKGDR